MTCRLKSCLYLMAKTNQTGGQKGVFPSILLICRSVAIHVTGDDLIRMGIKPGRIYTQILD